MVRDVMDVRATQLLKVQNGDNEANCHTFSQPGCAFGNICDCGKAVCAVDRKAAEGKNHGPF